MAFIKPVGNAHFSATVHACARLAGVPGDRAVLVCSYADADRYTAQVETWEEYHLIPQRAEADPQAWLISPEGPFAGAVLLAETLPVSRVQDLKWADIKAERDRREKAGFPYLGKIFDADSLSVQRMSVAVLAAHAALAVGEGFGISWTAQDNSIQILNAGQMIGMPAALALYADELHATARELRSAIYAEGATELSVGAISWPGAAAPAELLPDLEQTDLRTL